MGTDSRFWQSEAGAFSWLRTADSSKRKLKLAPEVLPLLMRGLAMKDGRMHPW